MRNILSFDLTGTLATFSYCNAVWFEGLPMLYAEKNNVPIDEAREYLTHNYNMVGDQATEWYDVKYWFERFGLGDGWGRLLEEFSHHIEFYPEAISTLQHCSEKYDLVLITNASREFAEIETAVIEKYFSSIISCVSDFGEVKKTPEFYARVCGSIGREPHEWIHVGDHWQFDYLAPRGAGITAFYLDRTQASSGEFIIHDLTELSQKLI